MSCDACGYYLKEKDDIYIIESKWGKDIYDDILYNYGKLYFVCPKELTKAVLEKGAFGYKKHITLFPVNVFEKDIKKNNEMLYPIVSESDDIIEVDLSGWYSKDRYKISVYMEMTDELISIYTEDNIDPKYLKVYKNEEI